MCCVVLPHPPFRKPEVAAPLPLPPFNPDLVAEILRDAASRAVMPRFQRLEAADFVTNSADDVVTRADVEAERIIGDGLRGLMPAARVVGEESGKDDPGLPEVFAGEEPVWVIDPVDGTRNFAAGSPDFCMMLALVQGQRTLWSWIYDPPRDSLTVAEAGAGSFCDGVRLKARPAGAAMPAEGRFIGMVNGGYFAKSARAEVKELCQRNLGRPDHLNCIGQDLLRQARGLRHYGFYRRLWCWDHAAPVLILREAGGVATRLDGQPYRAGDRVEALLCAPDAAIHGHVRELLAGYLTAT